MYYKTASGITIIEGLEAIRRRPSMYIGPEEPGHTLHQRVLEFAVDGAAHDSGPGKEVRLFLWAGGDITVAYDGAPLPIEPSGRPVEGVLHPGSVGRPSNGDRCGRRPGARRGAGTGLVRAAMS